MNAVVYARFSSHRQGEQSIEGQVAEAERFAAEHGLTIIHVYADRAQTGRNDNREQFQLMLSDATKHKFDALIVWKTDRIGRNKEEIALNKYHLKKNGIKIYYVAEMIPDTPEGIILESVIEGMAAYYSEQLSQNVRRGMKASATKAQCTGGNIPLGYVVDKDKKFVIDEKTAPTVRLIYDMYAKGQTVSQIIKVLNEKGHRTSRGAQFTYNSLRTILKSEKYIGVYTYNNEVRIENMVGVCGTSRIGNRHHYYYCHNQRKKLCNKKPVRQVWIENLVLEYVIKLVQDEELLEFIADNTYQYYVSQNTDTSYTDSLQKSLAEVEKAISNLIRAIEQGIFNDATKQRMDELDEQKAEIKAALASAKLKENLGLKKEHIVYLLHQFANMDYSDMECQKRLIKTFINSVFVYDDKVVLTFNYSGDNRTITLMEIDAGLQQGVRLQSDVAHQKQKQVLCTCFLFL